LQHQIQIVQQEIRATCKYVIHHSVYLVLKERQRGEGTVGGRSGLCRPSAAGARSSRLLFEHLHHICIESSTGRCRLGPLKSKSNLAPISIIFHHLVPLITISLFNLASCVNKPLK